uniref:Uncharacterized protein n=1 Tax=Caenorhabditis japonica TaxID=281687 RepID=A0A8R1I639_CAEJA
MNLIHTIFLLISPLSPLNFQETTALLGSARHGQSALLFLLAGFHSIANEIGMISSVATSSTTVIPVLSIRKGHELIGHLEDYLFWPYTFQSTILLVLFIVWIRKPVQNKFFNGAYSVKKKRYVKDKNYEAVANGGNEIV